jgi:hypothetical protein
MSADAGIRVLRGELAKGLAVLRRMEDYLCDFEKRKLAHAPGDDEAMALSQALTNYYTCLETLFLRISTFFENSLEEAAWHQSLLDRMGIEVPDVRPRVVSQEAEGALRELLKFRHFCRYYFEMDYDWDKLRLVLGKFHQAREVVRADLGRFDAFLSDLCKAGDQT